MRFEEVKKGVKVQSAYIYRLFKKCFVENYEMNILYLPYLEFRICIVIDIHVDKKNHYMQVILHSYLVKLESYFTHTP